MLIMAGNVLGRLAVRMKLQSNAEDAAGSMQSTQLVHVDALDFDLVGSAEIHRVIRTVRSEK
jgi:hypothetical protein